MKSNLPAESERRAMRELDKILNIISSISSMLELDEILAQVTENMVHILGVDGCAISRWNRADDTLVVLADYTAPHVELPHDDIYDIGASYPLKYYPATARVLKTQKPLIICVDDPQADDAERELLQAFQWGGVLMAPMLYKEQSVGLLELYTDNPQSHPFTDEIVSLCQILANQAAVALENARLYQEAEDGRLHAEAMQVISRTLASELDLQRTVRVVVDLAYQLVNARFVFLATPQVEAFKLVAMAGFSERIPADWYITGPTSAVLTQAIEGKRPIIITSKEQMPQADTPAQIDLQGWQSLVAVPLLAHNQVVGVLTAYAGQPNFFNPDDVVTLMSLASQAAVAIQNAQLFSQLDAQREALHQMSLRLVNAQEEERRRISRELHDELGQALTALKINLDVARHALPPEASPKLRQSVTEASQLAVRTLEAARSMSLELRPPMLDDLGLVSALRYEIDRYEQRTGLGVQFESNLKEAYLQPEVEITVYRIVVEALTNIARHAQASQVLLEVKTDDFRIKGKVEDNGQGFDLESWLNSAAEQQSLGLVSMRERAALLGGQLEVASQPGRGTTVSFTLPIR